MASTPLDWGQISPTKQKKLDQQKARSDALSEPTRNVGITQPGNVPPPLKMKTGKVNNAFASLKAYTTRPNRSVYNKKS